VKYSHIPPAPASSHQPGNSVFFSQHSSSSLPNAVIDDSCSNPCNEKCYENVVVELCDDLIAKKNDELKQEVEMLMKDLYRLKGKGIESNVQPSQDNREDMVKKFEKGSTVTCSKCHKEGHKSN
jgi:hypothetical protein